jgi:PDZ domain-containing protein
MLKLVGMSKHQPNSILHGLSLVVAGLLLVAGVAPGPDGIKSGFLGVEFAPLTRAAQARAPFLTRGGALVAKVVRGSPATAAGFVPGDVVTSIDGRTVSSADDAADALEAKKPGSRITVALYDSTNRATHAKLLYVDLASGPPQRRNVYTVEPPRTLAHAWDFKPSMAAHAAWSTKIARGAVNPLALRVFARGRCSAVAPEDWRVADADRDGKVFALVSPLFRARAIFAVVAMEKDKQPETTVDRSIAEFARVAPEMSASENTSFGFRVVDFGSAAGYSGYALYRVEQSYRAEPLVFVRIVAVPADNVATLAPLAGAVALSIRCEGARSSERKPFDDALSATSVSVRCLQGACDEGDFAGAYNDVMHTGYVHSASGENFLIDPRRDVWVTGPNGAGTYRQVSGMLEKLEPGRTN